MSIEHNDKIYLAPNEPVSGGINSGQPSEDSEEIESWRDRDVAEQSFQRLEESIQRIKSHFTDEAVEDQIQKTLETNNLLNKSEGVLTNGSEEELQLLRQKSDELLEAISIILININEINVDLNSAFPENIETDLSRYVKNLISGQTAKAGVLPSDLKIFRQNLRRYIESVGQVGLSPYADFFEEFAQPTAIKGLSSKEIDEKAAILLSPEALTKTGLTINDFMKEYEKIRFDCLREINIKFAKAYYDVNYLIHNLELIITHKADIIVNQGRIGTKLYSEGKTENEPPWEEKFKPLFKDNLIQSNRL